MLRELTPGGLFEPLTGNALSPDEARAIATRRAAALVRAGLRPGDRALLHYGNSARFFVDLIAVWAAGGCVVPVDERLSAFEISTIARAARPRLSLWDQDPPTEVASDLAGLDVRVVGTGELDGDGPGVPLPDRDDGRDALILFTSGTTGSPKGVVHVHRALAVRWRLQLARHGTDTLARTLCMLPTNFAWGLAGNALYAWLTGHDLYVVPAFRSDVLLRTAEICDAHAITYLPTVPAMWRSLLRMVAPPKRGTLRHVACGTSPFQASLWRDVHSWAGGAEVTNVYSMSECGAIASHSISARTPEDGLVGLPYDGVAIRIVPADTPIGQLADAAECAPGEPGAVCVRTPTLMRGYFERDDLTAEVVDRNWFRTGDLGARDGDGRLILRGRDRDMINVGGVKVYPADVDRVVESSALVREACTFALPDPLQGEQVAIAVVLAQNSPGAMEQVYGEIAGRLAPYQVPRRWYAVSELPRTERGKLSRAAVAAACARERAVDARALQSRALPAR